MYKLKVAEKSVYTITSVEDHVPLTTAYVDRSSLIYGGHQFLLEYCKSRGMSFWRGILEVIAPDQLTLTLLQDLTEKVMEDDGNDVAIWYGGAMVYSLVPNDQEGEG